MLGLPNFWTARALERRTCSFLCGVTFPIGILGVKKEQELDSFAVRLLSTINHSQSYDRGWCWLYLIVLDCWLVGSNDCPQQCFTLRRLSPYLARRLVPTTSTSRLAVVSVRLLLLLSNFSYNYCSNWRSLLFLLIVVYLPTALSYTHGIVAYCCST